MRDPIDVNVPTDLAWREGGPDLSRWRVSIRATGCAGWHWQAEDADGSCGGSGMATSLAGAEAAALDAILAETSGLVFDGEQLRQSVRARQAAAGERAVEGRWRIQVWPVRPGGGEAAGADASAAPGGEGREGATGWAWQARDDHGSRLAGSAPSRELAFAAARDAIALDWHGVDGPAESFPHEDAPQRNPQP